MLHPISSRGIRHPVPRRPVCAMPPGVRALVRPRCESCGSFHVVKLFMALGLINAVTLLALILFRVTFAAVGGRWAVGGRPVGGMGEECLGGRRCKQLIKRKENMIYIF